MRLWGVIFNDVDGATHTAGPKCIASLVAPQAPVRRLGRWGSGGNGDGTKLRTTVVLARYHVALHVVPCALYVVPDAAQCDLCAALDGAASQRSELQLLLVSLAPCS